jgi:hypothetical protein
MREYLAPGAKGFLQLFYSKSSNFQTFCHGKEKDNPLIMNNNSIVSGFLPLTPPLEEHHFGAYVEVGNDRGNFA